MVYFRHIKIIFISYCSSFVNGVSRYCISFVIKTFKICSKLLNSMQQKKSKTMALASFIFALFFWIPLLNLIFGALSIYLGIKALRKIKKESKLYYGKWYAVIAIILSALVYIFYFTGVVMCIYGYKAICMNIGLDFLA